MAEAATPAVTMVTGTIFTADGQRREFALTPDASWQQWGNVTARLGDTVHVVEAMQDALNEGSVFAEEDSDG